MAKKITTGARVLRQRKPQPTLRWQALKGWTTATADTNSAPWRACKKMTRARSRLTSWGSAQDRDGRHPLLVYRLYPVYDGRGRPHLRRHRRLVVPQKGWDCPRTTSTESASELDGGKAAVALVAKAAEADAVSAKLAELGGKPETHERDGRGGRAGCRSGRSCSCRKQPLLRKRARRPKHRPPRQKSSCTQRIESSEVFAPEDSIHRHPHGCPKWAAKLHSSPHLRRKSHSLSNRSPRAA